MNSKKIFSWSRRQSNAEVYHRTGGLLPIDTSPVISNGSDAKGINKTGKKRPSNLKIMLPEKKQIVTSPVANSYNAALAHAASNLQAAFDEMLRSPASMYTPCMKSPLIEKPLPSPPFNGAGLLIGNLPVELPGSILLENQGFPRSPSPVLLASTRPESRNSAIEEEQPEHHFESTWSSPLLSNLPPRILTHAKSFPTLSMRQENMSLTHSLNALNSSAIAHSASLGVHHRRTPSAGSSRRCSGQYRIAKPSATESKHTCSDTGNTDGSNISCKAHASIGGWEQPSSPAVGSASRADIGGAVGHQRKLSGSTTTTPLASNGKHLGEQNATTKTQESAISNNQAQPGSRSISNDTYIASLVDLYSAEVTSVKNNLGDLGEPSPKNPDLHHASGDNLSSSLETPTNLQTSGRERARNTTDGWSACSSVYSPNLSELSQFPQDQRRNPEMEKLKRKLSATRRSETYRNLIPELNQCKQNNVALQKQIEALMAKLNMSKQNEKALRTMVERAEQKSSEWKDAAGRAEKLASNVQGLQNTLDHLEHRLEIANIERLDAQEELFNTRTNHSPFDVALMRFQSVKDKDQRGAQETQRRRRSKLTYDSPTEQEAGSQDLMTIAAFIARIEELQEQLRQKDACIAELELGREKERLKHDVLMQEYQDVALQLDIQHQLLRRTQQMDAQVDELRTAIVDRDEIIQEKDTSISAIERQLEHHKTLLQAEIRRHATMKLHDTVENDPLPELTSLASKSDIDKWIGQLNHRLEKERKSNGVEPKNKLEADVERMRQEIDFYVREIIYFKLDIKGYKSDIRKLKRATAHMSNSTVDSQFDLPAHKRQSTVYASAKPDPNTPETTPRIGSDLLSMPVSMRRPITPPPSDSAIEFCFSPIDVGNLTNIQLPQQLDRTTTNQRLTKEAELKSRKQIEDLTLNSPSRALANLAVDYTQHMPESPASPPAIPATIDTPRSVSDSIIQLYASPRTPQKGCGLFSPQQADAPTGAMAFSPTDHQHEHKGRRISHCNHANPTGVHFAPHVKYTSARPVSVESAFGVRNSRSPTKKEDQTPRSAVSRTHSRNHSGSSTVPACRHHMPGTEEENQEPYKIRHDSGMGSSPLTGKGDSLLETASYRSGSASLIGKAI